MLRRLQFLFSWRSLSVLILAGLFLQTPVLALRPERSLDPRKVKTPSYLAGLGLKPENPARPANGPSESALQAFERLERTGPWQITWDPQLGTVQTLFGGSAGPYRGAAEAAARAFLREYPGLFGLNDGPAPKHESTFSTRGGTRVLFVQRHRGLTVHGGSITVLLDDRNRVRMAFGGFLDVTADVPALRLPADVAVRKVLRHVDPGAELARDISPGLPPAGIPADGMRKYKADDTLPGDLIHLAQTRPVWWPSATGLKLAWTVDVSLASGPREFRVWVDGETGEILDSRMLSHTTHEQIRIYPTNPDRSDLTVEDIPTADKPNSDLTLNGVFTDVANSQAPVINDGNFLHSTDPDDPTVDLNFDEQNVFWHNNLIRDYFRALNGGPNVGGFLNLDTNSLDSTVHITDAGDPDVDNAFFTPLTDRTSFGHGSFHTGQVLGSRDFALEDSVVYHEYSHRINNNSAGFGGAVYGGAMNEGTADYWAASFADEKYIGEYANADPEVGDYSGWVGLYGFVRSMDNARTLLELCDNPFVTDGCQVHSDGEIWGGTLWDLRQNLIAARGKIEGVAIADSLIWEMLFNLPGASDTFVAGRDAILGADDTLYADAYECLIWSTFAARGMGSGTTMESPPTTPPVATQTLPAGCNGTPTVSFSAPAYDCSDPDSGTVTIEDPNGGAKADITVTTDSGDSETIAISWNGTTATTAAFDVEIGTPIPSNGVVEVSAAGERILATYLDDSPAREAWAASTVDCTPDLRFVSSRVLNGSCDLDDPFLDAGETALIDVTLELELGIEQEPALDTLTLTLVSNNSNVTVSAPQTIIPSISFSGTKATIVGRWGIEGDAGATAGEVAPFDVTVGGGGFTGSESPISFTELLEQDLDFVPQTILYSFTSGDDGFVSVENGQTATNRWARQTRMSCSTNGAYFHQGATGNCGNYAITDSSWLSTPFIRIQDHDAKHASRLTGFRFFHNVDFQPDTLGAPFIENDRFDLAEGLQQLPALYDDLTPPGWVQESFTFPGDLPPGFDIDHGWVRFRWLFDADASDDGGLVAEGWFVDEVEVDYDLPQEVADVNAAGSCAADASFNVSSTTIMDGTGGGAGNSDGAIDQGETINLSVAVENVGTEVASAVIGHLTSDRPDIITFTDGSADFPDVFPLASEDSLAPHFSFTVDPSAECNAIITFTLTMDYNGVPGGSVAQFILRTGSLGPGASPFVYDDFEINSGLWTVNPGLNPSGPDDATSGVWERADPRAYNYGDDPPDVFFPENTLVQPEDDFTTGTADTAYITQNEPPLPATDPFNLHDVDNGKTTLQSNAFNLTTRVEPTVGYARWVYNRDGNEADAFLFQMSNNNGLAWTTVESVFDENPVEGPAASNVWTQKTWLISEIMPLASQMKFRFVAQDQSGQIIEALVDDFELRESTLICNPFTATTPGEVSGPGAAIPFEVDRTTPGSLDLSWESTPDAVSYMIVTGNIADLQTSGGVVFGNASPAVCGVAGTSTVLTEPAGSVFLLVLGEGAGGVGPAGDGTSVTRTPDLACP